MNDNQSIPRITSKSYISNDIKLAFNTTPPTKISHHLNIEVRKIYSPEGVVTTNLFLSEANSQSTYNANAVLTKDLLDPESERTHASLPKTNIVPIMVFELACSSSIVITNICVWVLYGR